MVRYALIDVHSDKKLPHHVLLAEVDSFGSTTNAIQRQVARQASSKIIQEYV